MTRIKKISVTLEELNRFLVSKGLKPLPPDYKGAGVTNTDPANGDPDVFGSTPPAVAEQKKTAPAQPTWKWSWDPTGGLLIWPVDKKYGQPHHVEVTGPNFWKLAQGRVYETAEGEWEILVWEDRASEEWQDQAVDDVNEWLLTNTGKEAEDAFWQSEGGYYQTIGDKTPDTDKMIETYFGVGMDKLPKWKKDKLRKEYQGLFGTQEDLAPDPMDQHQKNDDMWLDEMASEQALDYAWQDAYKKDDYNLPDCPDCGGEGLDSTNHTCLTCKGTGIDHLYIPAQTPS